MTAIRGIPLSVLLLLGAAGQALAQGVDRPPSQPAGLQVSVYGKTSGAVSWQRSTDDRGAVRGYEVTRDGAVVVAERDALSHVAKSLSPGTSYRFGVTAIDSAGQRSRTTFATLTTNGGGSSGASGGSSTPAVGTLAAPDGLRATVYSDTNGEIFWRRATTPGLSYVVLRDGRTVTTTTGVSHYDGDLVPGRAHVYEVVAIDPDGRRSAPATVTLPVDGDATGGSSGGGNGPSAPAPSGLAAPTGLRATAYSKSNGEISWTRPSTPGLRYEVTRDGREVATTDGISYYDGDLAAGRSYVYEVVAIDRRGRRSAPASVTLSTGGGATGGAGGSDGGGDPSTPAPSAVAAPTNVSASVYSSTSAEITWARPDTFGLTYDVLRDGSRVTTTDGVSHYEGNLSAGRSYVYEVVAIDRQGRRSAPATVMFDTPASGSSAGGPTTPTTPSTPTTPTTPVDPATPTDPGTPTPPGDPLPPLTPPPMAGSPIEEPSDLYRRDGYGTVNVVRVDVRTETTAGTCNADDDSGCTLDDVNADNDPEDDLKVEIPVHFQADDFPDDGKEDNAELRQRGATARLSDQKSYRIELKGKGVRWRGEDRLQLNKNPYDPSKIRNKLAFDLMSEIPNLPSMRTQFVDLWIDDGAGPVPYGLFTHVEAAVEEYLENRDWDKDDHLYKAEKFLYSGEDLRLMALDEDGEPLDEDAFESRLEIKGGGDHRKLIEMTRAVSDKGVPFDETLARYFDEDNLVTWVTVNVLLRQIDAVTHNFYLYNPVDSDTFYIIPWDYDQTFAYQEFPTGGFSEEDLIKRLNYGYARVTASEFLKRLYETPGFHDKVLAKADELRRGPLMDSVITERANRYTEVVAPVAGRQPDEYKFDRNIHRQFASFVSRSHDALRSTYSIPMPPSLAEPRIDDGQVEFRWSPAYDVTGGTLTYDLEVSRSADFSSGSRVFLDTRIPDDPERVRYDVPLDRLPSGTLYARLVARVDRDPARFWQISSNRAEVGGERRIGIQEFRVP